MEAYADLLQSVGFPIFCVLMLGFFIYQAFNKISAENKEREEKLYTMLANAQSTIENAVSNNVKLAAQIEIMQKSIENLAEDIEDIKDSVTKKEE